MNEKQKNHIDRFFTSWSRLNKGLTAFECEHKGLQYVGFNDPRVQVFWKTLKMHERLLIVTKYGLETEEDLYQLLNTEG